MISQDQARQIVSDLLATWEPRPGSTGYGISKPAEERPDLYVFGYAAHEAIAGDRDYVLIGGCNIIAVEKRTGRLLHVEMADYEAREDGLRRWEVARGYRPPLLSAEEVRRRARVFRPQLSRPPLVLPRLAAFWINEFPGQVRVVDRLLGTVHHLPAPEMPFGLAVAAFAEEQGLEPISPADAEAPIDAAEARRRARRLLRHLDPQGEDGLTLAEVVEERRHLFLFPTAALGAPRSSRWPYRVAVVRATGEVFVVPSSDLEGALRAATSRRGLPPERVTRDEAVEAVRRWVAQYVLPTADARRGVRIALEGPFERPALWGVRVRLSLPDLGPAAPVDLVVDATTGEVHRLEEDGLELPDALAWWEVEHDLRQGSPAPGADSVAQARGRIQARVHLGEPAQRVEDRPGLWLVHGPDGVLAIDKLTEEAKPLCERPWLEGAARDLEQERGHASPPMGRDEAAGLARAALGFEGEDAALLLEATDRGRLWVVSLAAFASADDDPPRWRRLPPIAVVKETCGAYPLAGEGPEAVLAFERERGWR